MRRTVRYLRADRGCRRIPYLLALGVALVSLSATSAQAFATFSWPSTAWKHTHSNDYYRGASCGYRTGTADRCRVTYIVDSGVQQRGWQWSLWGGASSWNDERWSGQQIISFDDITGSTDDLPSRAEGSIVAEDLGTTVPNKPGQTYLGLTTLFETNDGSNEIVAFTMRINSNPIVRWHLRDTPGIYSDQSELRSLVTHELGHALGLGHAFGSGGDTYAPIMKCSFANGLVFYLQQDDREGLHYLYRQSNVAVSAQPC